MPYRSPILLALVFLVVPSPPPASGELDVDRAAAHAVHGGAAEDMRPVELLPLPGIAQPARQVTMSAPMEGMLMDVCVSEGEHVELGQVLAVIDNRVAEASVHAARAAADRSGERQHALEELKFAQEVYDRQLSLQATQNGSDFELLEALTRLEKAKASIVTVDQEETRAKLLLQLELVRLETHNIRAPFSGQIVRIHAQPGVTLTRDDDLLTIVSVAELKADLYVSLDRYSQLRLGSDYPLRAGPPVNRVVTARLQFVAPVIDAASHTCRATFTVDNRDQHLPAGFSVYLDATPESTVPAPPSTP